jgi:hypothetical protein
MPDLLIGAKARAKLKKFDPEGDGYDSENAAPLMKSAPLKELKPDKFRGELVGNSDGSDSFQ